LKATSGAMGIAALFTALLGSNASGSFKIVAYGLLLELARRAITWLYTRFAIGVSSCSLILERP
jgi:hypothetical protein